MCSVRISPALTEVKEAGRLTRFINKVSVEGAAVDANFASAFEKRFAGDSLWKIERDADGFASLVKYRFSSAK